jgi:hypothetical protein
VFQRRERLNRLTQQFRNAIRFVRRQQCLRLQIRLDRRSVGKLFVIGRRGRRSCRRLINRL